MKPEHWQQLDKLFHAALEREPDERAAFLDDACAGDESLREQVKALLAADGKARSFIESPAMEVEARGVAVHANTEAELSTGETVSHYRIISKLGVGGMGVVYLAEDSSLGRQIALKLLPVGFTRNTDRVRRFQQEARAASALNHPNIVTIHEIGQVGGRHFIATEFIDGQTLRQRISGVQARITGDASGKSGTPLPLRGILNIVIQTADALTAAHEAGILHRDIKPENIMVRRRDGYVKVLDFGLAKLIEGAVDTEAPTRAQVKTSAGLVMGTPSYMSPEQARGEPVDARTDIWSLGVVLYELVAGCGPFERSTPSEVIALILEREPPPLARYARDLPERLEEIVNKTLTKDREERYQTAKDLLVDLRRLRQQLEIKAEVERLATPVSGSEVAVTTDDTQAATDEATARTQAEMGRRTSSAEYLLSGLKRHQQGVAVALVILGIVAAGIVFGLYRFLTNNRPSPSSMKITRMTNIGNASEAAISPDGKDIVYVKGGGGPQSIWVRQVVTDSNVQIVPPGDGQYWGLTFSSDSNYVFYIKGKSENSGELYQLPRLGGSERKLTSDVGSPITFSPDGKRFAFVRSSQEKDLLIIANADGSGEQTLARATSCFCGGAAWSPDGKTIATAVESLNGGRHLEAIGIEVEGGKEKPISSHRWQRVGRIVWLADGSGLVMAATENRPPGRSQVWQLSFPGGEARRLTPNDLNDYETVSLTADSNAMVAVQTEKISNIWVTPDGDADRATQITPGLGKYDVRWGLSWTPDGKVVYTSNASDNADIWIMDADGGNLKQLTTNAGNNVVPFVTPDGRYIVYTSDRSGGQIWRMNMDGNNPKQLTSGSPDHTLPNCSPDSQWVVYGSWESGYPMLWRVPIDGGTPVQLSDKQSFGGVVSPDGKLIACNYVDSPEAKQGIAIIPFDGGPPIKMFDSQPRNILRWTSDGRSITYKVTRNGVSNIWSQPIDGGPPKQLTNFKSEQIFFYDWSRDGKLACSRGVTTRDVVLIRDFR